MRLVGKLLAITTVLLLAVVASLACSQQPEEEPSPRVTRPSPPMVEQARQLTQRERDALESFVVVQHELDGEWASLHGSFDEWRAGLTECHPSAARESLRGFAATFSEISDRARKLERARVTSELTDTVIEAAIAEELAFRTLRDMWQPGNVSLLENAERQKADAALAHNSVKDQILTLREEYGDGPTPDEFSDMETFSASLDPIADAWDEFHDDYAVFAKQSQDLTQPERSAGYVALGDQLKAVRGSLQAISDTDVTEEYLEKLLDAIATELAALQELATGSAESSEGSMPMEAAAPASPNDSAPEGGAGEGMEGDQGMEGAQTEWGQLVLGGADESAGQTPPTEPTGAPPPQAAPSADLTSLVTALEATISESESALAEVEDSIDVFVNDKSALRLEELTDFEAEFRSYVAAWGSFYAAFADWRATNGGCDQQQVEEELNDFSLEANQLARRVRQQTQLGLLLPVYKLSVEAADLEADAMRSLVNAWTPFAVDSFRAVDEARREATMLRRQAGIALHELQER